jgi:hypothetical protein
LSFTGRVDPAHVAPPSRAPAAWLAGERTHPAVRGELRLIEATALPGGLRTKLDACAALHPVLQQAGARLIVLPDVRVELRDASAAQALRAEVTSGTPPASVAELAGAALPTLVLRPRSGRGADALALAEALRRPAGGREGGRPAPAARPAARSLTATEALLTAAAASPWDETDAWTTQARRAAPARTPGLAAANLVRDDARALHHYAYCRRCSSAAQRPASARTCSSLSPIAAAINSRTVGSRKKPCP